jgi:hypothetical protein
VPRKVVDFSARSEVFREEPFYGHFWECTPREYLAFLRNPRAELEKIGIRLPAKCRIETIIENHDWLADHTNGIRSANGTIVCNTGGGNVARDVYRIISYGHTHETVGKFKKRLLHSPTCRPPRRRPRAGGTRAPRR